MTLTRNASDHAIRPRKVQPWKVVEAPRYIIAAMMMMMVMRLPSPDAHHHDIDYEPGGKKLLDEIDFQCQSAKG